MPIQIYLYPDERGYMDGGENTKPFTPKQQLLFFHRKELLEAVPQLSFRSLSTFEQVIVQKLWVNIGLGGRTPEPGDEVIMYDSQEDCLRPYIYETYCVPLDVYCFLSDVKILGKEIYSLDAWEQLLSYYYDIAEDIVCSDVGSVLLLPDGGHIVITELIFSGSDFLITREKLSDDDAPFYHNYMVNGIPVIY